MIAAPAPPATPTWLVLLGVVMTFVGGTGGLTGLLVFLRQRRRENADTAKVLSDAAVAMVEPLERRLAATERRLTRVENQLRALTRAIMQPDASIEALRRLVLAQNRRGEERDDRP